MDIEYVLFDLDGTLTNPALGITNSIMHVMRHYEMKVPKREELYSYIGPPLVDKFHDDWGFSREKSIEALEIYRQYFAEYGIFENEAYDGIHNLLEKLAKSGKKIYLATSKPEIYARRILKHFNLDEYFTYAAGNTLHEDRPTKYDVIKYLLETRKEIEIEKAVMVGDREHDVIGAHKAGMKCIGVLYGFGDREEHQSAGADVIAESISELENILLKGCEN